MTTTAPPGGWTRQRVLRWALAAVAVVAVALVGGHWYAARASAAIDVNTRSFRTYPTYATLTFDVGKPAAKAAVCDISARDIKSVVLGTLTGVKVPARTDGQRVTTLNVTVRTSELANVVEVDQCVAVPG